MSKSLISGLQDAHKEKLKKIERCEEALAAARADAANYVAKISEALGLKTSKKPGPKKSQTIPLGVHEPKGHEPEGNLKVIDEVLRLFKDGTSRSEIADELGISMASVYQHLSSLRKDGRLPPAGKEVEGHGPEGHGPKTPTPSEQEMSEGRTADLNDAAAEGDAVVTAKDDEDDDAGDGYDGSGGGDSILALRAEVALQQAGVRSVAVHFATTPMNGHAHKVIVDRMGDGSTQPDSTGHGHRFYRFVSSQTNKHGHDLLVPLKG